MFCPLALFHFSALTPKNLNTPQGDGVGCKSSGFALSYHCLLWFTRGDDLFPLHICLPPLLFQLALIHSICLPTWLWTFLVFFFLESNPNTKCSMHTRTRLGKEAWNLQEDHHAASCHNSIISIKGQKILQSMHQLVSRLPTLFVVFFKFRLHENWESGCPQFAPPCSDATAKLSMLQRYMKW